MGNKWKQGLLWVLAGAVCLPAALLFVGSFMGAEEIAAKLGPVLADGGAAVAGTARLFLLPEYPTLQPLVELLLDSPEFFTMFWNTCLLVLPVLAGQLAVAAPAAWGFAQFRFRGRRPLFFLYVALMLMPFQVTMVSNYFVLDFLRLLDTRWAVILPGIFSTFPVFILYRLFRAVPKELLEAAAIDGAGPLRTFLSVGIPLGAPGIASAMMLGFLEYWNAIEQPLTFFQNKALWPLSLYLPEIVTGNAAVSFAASLLMLLPPFLVFLLGQRHLEQGIRAAGLKE